MSTIWTEDIKQLFAFNLGIIPHAGQPLPDTINALTRLSLLSCIIIALFKPVLAVSTFLTIAILLLAFYYVHTSKEDYVDIDFPATSNRFCNDIRPITYDSTYFSKNQQLVGKPNPKTLMPPIIAPPSHELSEWKATDLVTHSSINTSTNFDPYTSGYCSDYRPKICSECLLAPCRCPTRSEKLLTSTIQPGVYERSDFSEPINSLIGITQQKQFDPKRIDIDRCGITYSSQLPDITVNDDPVIQSEFDVYDPRFTGYGPTDRGYTNPTSDTPSYFYDDINSVTMPNFLARSKVDIYPWAVQYGSGINGTKDNVVYGDGYRQMAEGAYLDDTIKFRTELQERLMRKRNSEMWQLRVAPIRTM